MCESKQENYQAISLNSLANLEERIQETACSVVILDLDTLPVNNRFIRNLKVKRDKMHIIGLSSRPFHPELEEAMSSHIYACLSKPVDPDELTYLLKSIYENKN